MIQAEAAPESLLRDVELCQEELLAAREYQPQGEELREEVGIIDVTITMPPVCGGYLVAAPALGLVLYNIYWLNPFQKL